MLVICNTSSLRNQKYNREYSLKSKVIKFEVLSCVHKF